MNKKVILVAGLAFATSAMAMNKGYYVGLQLGQSVADLGRTTQDVNGTSVQYTQDQRKGLAGRLQYGYMSTPNFGTELNFTKYAEAKWKTNVGGSAQPKATFDAYNLDFLLRFDLILSKGMDLYAKPGLALLRTRYKEKADGFRLNETEYFLRPELALGLSYSFNKRWTAEIEADRVFGKGSLGNAITHENASWYLPNLDLYTAGVTYSF